MQTFQMLQDTKDSKNEWFITLPIWYSVLFKIAFFNYSGSWLVLSLWKKKKLVALSKL